MVELIEPDPDKVFIKSMTQEYLRQEVNPWIRPDEERVVMVARPERTPLMRRPLAIALVPAAI